VLSRFRASFRPWPCRPLTTAGVADTSPAVVNSHFGRSRATFQREICHSKG
jgi:hypothetical protein